MGYMDIKIKLMPSSVETDLDEIKDNVKIVIESHDGKGLRFEEEPVAFGLKAIIISFTIPENKELEPIEKELEDLENVASEEMIDMRRAIG